MDRMSDDGGPAFPMPATEYGNGGYAPQWGMSLRDYLAAKVMHAELVTSGAVAASAKALIKAADGAGQTIEQRVAWLSYDMADAMLKERAKRAGRAGEGAMVRMSGAELIAAERQRQVEEEGYDAAHDDTHGNGALARAAECYRVNAFGADAFVPELWPFESDSWRPTDDLVRDLAKSGALYLAEEARLQRVQDVNRAATARQDADWCAAEIDRLQRQAQQQESTEAKG